jgi:hypothetical protein
MALVSYLIVFDVILDLVSVKEFYKEPVRLVPVREA